MENNDSRIAVLETTMDYIKDTLSDVKQGQIDLSNKFDKFMESVSERYATKEEVIDLKQSTRTAMITAVVGVFGFLTESIFLLIQKVWR